MFLHWYASSWFFIHLLSSDGDSTYLLISDILSVAAGWFLHGSQTHHLKKMVLHYISIAEEEEEEEEEKRREEVLAVLVAVMVSLLT